MATPRTEFNPSGRPLLALSGSRVSGTRTLWGGKLQEGGIVDPYTFNISPSTDFAVVRGEPKSDRRA